MRTRNIEKHFRLTAEEAEDLRSKARLAGLGESALLRVLLTGYCPKQKPDRDFYKAMSDLNAAANRLSEAVEKNQTDLDDEVRSLRQLRLDIQKRYLQPERSDLKWR